MPEAPDPDYVPALAYHWLTPGGERHVADWRRPANFVMRGLIEDAGFVGVGQRQAFSTMFGTLALYRAVKPAS